MLDPILPRKNSSQQLASTSLPRYQESALNMLQHRSQRHIIITFIFQSRQQRYCSHVSYHNLVCSLDNFFSSFFGVGLALMSSLGPCADPFSTAKMQKCVIFVWLSEACLLSGGVLLTVQSATAKSCTSCQHAFQLVLQAVDENRAIAMFVHAAARRAAIAH